MGFSQRFIDWIRNPLGWLAFIIFVIIGFALTWFLFTDYLLRGITMEHSTRKLIAIPLSIITMFVVWSFLSNVVAEKK